MESTQKSERHFSKLTPYEQAARLAVLAGGEEVLYQKARAAIYSGDPRWASSLAEHLLVLAPDRLDYHLLLDDAFKAIGERVMAGSWRCFVPSALDSTFQSDAAARKHP